MNQTQAILLRCTFHFEQLGVYFKQHSSELRELTGQDGGNFLKRVLVKSFQSNFRGFFFLFSLCQCSPDSFIIYSIDILPHPTQINVSYLRERKVN